MKKIILAAAVAALAVMAIASSASADVARYQMQSMTITAVQPEGAVGQWDNVWTHTYNVVLNPCDGSFSGVGSMSGTINGPYSNETIKGQLDGNAISFTATRPDGVEYSLSNAPLNDNTKVTHGDLEPCGFVGARVQGQRDEDQHVELQEPRRLRHSKGGGSDAAHSCIGMPIH